MVKVVKMVICAFCGCESLHLHVGGGVGLQGELQPDELLRPESELAGGGRRAWGQGGSGQDGRGQDGTGGDKTNQDLLPK